MESSETLLRKVDKPQNVLTDLVKNLEPVFTFHVTETEQNRL